MTIPPEFWMSIALPVTVCVVGFVWTNIHLAYDDWHMRKQLGIKNK